MKLNLTRVDTANYCRKNQYAMMMIHQATEDYAAARCCILNGLGSGFIVAAQAFEKILKGLIYLTTNSEPKNIHNTSLLKEELKKHKDYGLDKYDGLLKSLYGHYQSRYYDNPIPKKGKHSTELIEMDKLWLHLVESLPLPDEVKYRSGTYEFLVDRPPYDEWLKKNNASLLPKIKSIKKRYEEVMQYLYK